MMITGSLPALSPSQDQSSSISLQQTSENDSGDFSALLFLIFASPNPQAVTSETAGQLAPTESDATDVAVSADANENDNIGMFTTDTQLAFAERAAQSPAPSAGFIPSRKDLSQLKSLLDSAERDVVYAPQSNVTGQFGLVVPVLTAATGTNDGAGLPEGALAGANGPLTRPANGGVESAVQGSQAVQLLASDEPIVGDESESALSARSEPSELQGLPGREAQANVAAQRDFTRGPIDEALDVDAAPQSGAVTAEGAADGKNDIVKKLTDTEMPQPVRGMAVNLKTAELSYEKSADTVKVVAGSNGEFAANDALSTAHGATKSGVFVSSSPAQALTKPTETEWTGDKPGDTGQVNELAINQKPDAGSSAGRDQHAAFDFDSRGDKAPGSSFKNGRAHTEMANPSSNFSAISLRAIENGAAAGDPKPGVSWSPVINQVAEEIAGNVRGNKHEAVMILDPPELGKVKIGLAVDGDKVQVRIFAEARESQGLIQNHLSELKQALVSHHLDLVDARVDGGSWNGSNAGGDFMHGFQHNARGQQEAGLADARRGASEVVDSPAINAAAEKGRVSIRA